MKSRTGTLIPAIMLIMLGVIFLLPSLGIPFLSWGGIWPLFIIAAGLGFLAGFIFSARHDEGLAFVGSAAVMVGGFLGLFAWHILDWNDMARWWPGFPLIGGLAFVVLWAAGRFRDWGVLVPALIGIVVGVVGLLFTFGAVGENVLQFWPVLVILAGVISLLSALFRRRE
ncbi:MAG: hypothetical protein SWK90_11840 [Chloroflexota bacterium]|nr:hypothetical protein [Chloroflexota bacterium]